MFKTILFVTLLFFSFNANAYVPASLSSQHVSIEPADVYSIVATPEKNDTTYVLKVYQEEGENAVMTATRPLDGEIVDIVIKDVDHDGKDELVVAMQERMANRQKVHFDVFEFEGASLQWVSFFPDLGGLVSSFSVLMDKR